MGYSQAGFDIVGVDIAPQPNYPFEFYQADALNLVLWDSSFTPFDLIHASPPCQAFSTSTADKSKHSDLIEPTRTLLKATGLPYVIENVQGAPLRAHIRLCGSMFGLDIQRHRLFELSGFPLILTPPCNHKAWDLGRPHTVTGNPAGHTGQWHAHSQKYADTAHGRELLEVPWMKTNREITEAIPPAYTKYIGEAFLAQVTVDVP